MYNESHIKFIIFSMGIMAETKYKTKQRDEILRFFEENREGCFSVRDVISSVSAGEATVFRTVSSLTEQGKLKRYTVAEGRGECAYYQYNACPSDDSHIHLMCEDCGRIIHMDCNFMNEIISHFKLDHSFLIDSARTVIYGKCESCTSVKAHGGGHRHE